MSSRNIYLETFGCQMNVLDSELVQGQLTGLGYRFVATPDDADVILYNTCSVRDQAEQKVRSRLGEIAIRKREEPSLVVGVIGCMAERDGVALMKRAPVVDILCGPGELDRLPTLLDNAARTRSALAADSGSHNGRLVSAGQVALQGAASRRSAVLDAARDNLELLDLSRVISPVDHSGSAYVRITRGCNKFCSYCVVPMTRGAETHRPPDTIVDECRRLADAGVVEVTLLGQTVNHYRFEHGAAVTVQGVAMPQKGRVVTKKTSSCAAASARVTSFADLLRRIHDEAPAIKRLRFVTSFPRDFGDDALEAIRDCPRICRYLHVPAQSGSDAVLRRMNRGYNVGEYLDFIDRARDILDEPKRGRPLMIAGDFIVGFCGETDDDFRATTRLLERVNYKNCFIFKYSPRPGAAAYDHQTDDVPEPIKRARNNELLAIQNRISDRISREQIGGVFDVFIEGVSAMERKRRAPKATNGSLMPVTVEGAEPAASIEPPTATIDAPVQLTARTEGDLIVLLDTPRGTSPDDLIGAIRRVRITKASGLTLWGELTPPEA